MWRTFWDYVWGLPVEHKRAHEFTSAEVAKIAARGLRRPESLSVDEISAVCGSALNQTRDRT